MPPFRLTYGLATEMGSMGKTNNDSLIARTWPNGAGLFAVADGNPKDGKIASQLACDIILGEMDTYFHHDASSSHSNTEISSILKTAIHKANRELLAQTPQSGTSFTAVLVVGECVYIAHVGDARVYLISDNATQQLTEDHMWSDELMRQGYLTAEDLKEPMFDDFLHRYLGREESVEVDLAQSKPTPNTWLLICTKGLRHRYWEGVSDEEIHSTLAQNDPQTAAEKLVSLAKAGDSYLDISAIIIKFDLPQFIPLSSLKSFWSEISKPHFTYGLTTTKGTARDVNQDSVIALTWSNVSQFSGQDVGLFIVADGMGAPESGLKASQTAVQIVSQEIENAIFAPSDLSISQIMTAAVQKANLQVMAEADDGGTTLTAALLIGNQAYIAHVGNTLAYYVSEKDIVQLTETHDIMHRLVALGQMTWEDINSGKYIFKNVLYRALGMAEKLEVDIVTERLEPNSYLVLSTDGLWVLGRTFVEKMNPLSVTQNNPPQLACELLTELSTKCGSGDDITVIVVKLSDE